MRSYLRKIVEFLDSNLIDEENTLNLDFVDGQVEYYSDPHKLEILHHPVHITGEEDKMSSSAFIPFCSFGGMKALGEQIANFSLPVCRGFKKRILDGKLCYVIDVNRFKEKLKIETLQEVGLSLLVDVNDEFDLRELSAKNIEKVNTFEDFTEEFIRVEESEKILTYIETISRIINIKT